MTTESKRRRITKSEYYENGGCANPNHYRRANKAGYWMYFREICLSTKTDYSRTIYITLNKIKKLRPCKDGWEKLLAHLDKTKADDEEFPLAEVLKSNGLDHALWCLRCLPEHDSTWRLLAVKFAREVQHLMKDERSIKALDVAEKHANGEATDQELKDVRTAAEDVRTADSWGYLNANLVHWSAAAWAARDAAIAASFTLRHIVWTAKYSAWAATHSTAQDAAQGAAWAAAREKQGELFLEAIQ